MNLETVVAIISATIAIGALCLTARQVHQAGEQTKLQREQTELQHKLQGCRSARPQAAPTYLYS
ncbi:hypothetical protein SAMN04488548_134195 [Gordonia westfalica]|uniref:Uncharacterized protein n=1 Tax=Gordonia westfalica TaxID=158898 RepID=A0A1H2GZN3_9ACTN|nr:hypothetical protein SAMN04488548_134195 [Gordonia westfalica]